MQTANDMKKFTGEENMRKIGKEERKNYFFDNKALLALIIPLVIEQLLAVLVGMADHW